MLAGTGLLYARTGTFDFATMGEAVARTGSDPVLTAGFVLLAGALLTKAAVLRAAARIFGGASGVPGPELPAPTEREREKLDRPLWLMALPALVLVALALAKAAMPFLGAVAARLSDPALPPPALPEAGWGNLAPLLLIAALFAFALRRRRALRGPAQAITRGERSAFRALQALHSGLVSDYVTWMAAGLALFAPAAGFPVGPTGP